MTANSRRITLGDMVRDTITGLEGIVVADCMWLFGCRRLTIQPAYLKDGKPGEMSTFDEAQLVLLHPSTISPRLPMMEAANHPLSESAARVYPGGPQPEPTRAPDPERL